ncbi:pD-(D/E)xk nuclease superfamily [Caudoviricetes sp.]|nr:pD-(D/E)xk nuclease superfamily [Caudoviricetes sp.]
MQTNITIRPSSVDTFLQCPQQWYRVFIKGETSIPSARAAIGTAIHKGVEVMWQEAMLSRKKDANLGMMHDAAIMAFHEEGQKGLQYDKAETESTAEAEVVKGVTAFVEDVVPFTEIPSGVEKRFTVDIANHPVVARLSGTVDYIVKNTIADVKTSKRTPTTANYEIQQSLYTYLATENGEVVKNNLIQAVVLTKEPKGAILPMEVNIAKAKYAVNSLLDTTEVMAKDIVHPDVLFRGNPKYYLCSKTYCAFFDDCKFVTGEAKDRVIPIKPLL